MTSKGLGPNHRNPDAVRHFPRPTNLRQLRQFFGLTSYYRKLIAGYTKIAHPLHSLTRKGALFNWSAECDTAFDCLRLKLMTTPLLTLKEILLWKQMLASVDWGLYCLCIKMITGCIQWLMQVDLCPLWKPTMPSVT